MRKIILLLFLFFTSLHYGQEKHDTATGNFSLFKNKGKWGIMKCRNIVVKAKYDFIRIKSNTTFMVISKSKAGVLDSLGNTLIPYKYDGIVYLFDDVYAVQVGKKWGAVNRSGTEILPVTYDLVDKAAENIGAASIYTGHVDLPTGVPRFKMSYNFYLFNRSGLIDGTAYHDNVLVEGCTFYSDGFNLYQYLHASVTFSEGVAAINSHGNAVFVDPAGNRVFGKSFGYAANFKDGYAIVGIGDKVRDPDAPLLLPFYSDYEYAGLYGVIDRAGREVIPCIYEKLASYNDYNKYSYTSGFIPAKLHGKWGAINIKQEIIIPFEYDLLETEGDLVIIMSGKKLGLADVHGKLLIPVQYDDLRISDEKILVKERGSYFVIDKTGKRVN